MNRLYSENGFVLLMTLWILAILSALLISFSMAVSSNIKAASYQRDDIDALLLARSGLTRLSAALMQPESLGKDAELALIHGDHLGVWYINPRDWSLSREPLEETDQQSSLECYISAEDSKLPLAKTNVAMLGKLPGMTPVLAERIVAFIGERGKENPLKMVEELLLVDEVGGKIYDSEKDEVGLIEVLTTFSDGKVYINGTTVNVLLGIPGVDRDLAQEFAELIEQDKYLERIEDVRGVLGVTPPIYKSLKQWLKVTPIYHRLRVTAKVGGIERTVNGIYKLEQNKVTPLFISGG